MNIIGKSECTASQMAQYLINKNPASKDWALKYAQIYLEEGATEGVRGDGAWIQSCKETGNFKFEGGTAVTFDQNNFCGLGVTRKGMKGHSFKSPRLGIRAQIQHLKGYATTSSLVNPCIDPRYNYINPKGKAPRFEDLAGKWAVPGYDTSKASSLQDAMKKRIGYGFDIINGIETMKSIKSIPSNDSISNANNPTNILSPNKLSINVHAGHNPDGKVACGAVGLIKESTESRKIKDLVVKKLKELGHTVYDCTVDNGTSANDVLKRIVQKCNSHIVDLDISIHFNAGANNKVGDGKSTGTEVYIYSPTSKAKKYAQNIVNSISLMGFKNRGVKTSSSLYVLKNTKSPALLIECCFIDDFDDVELYNCENMAKAIVYGITGNLKNDVFTIPTEATKKSVLIHNGLDYSPVFNHSYYINKYSDVKRTFGNNIKQIFNHFIQYGMTEGRQGCSDFNVILYKKKYLDLQKAFGDNLPKYYHHYVQYGRKEGRKGT